MYVTGTLKTWDIMDRLPEIAVRTLLVGGRYDECTPVHLEEMHRRIAGSRGVATLACGVLTLPALTRIDRRAAPETPSAPAARALAK